MNDDGIALYIHWPFCVSKCPYCDFNSHVRATIDEEAWRAALLRELRFEAERTPGRMLHSIFFGGGTPSLMPPATVAALIDAATSLWRAEEDVEITLEANPSSVESARFRGFRLAGVNRISLGLQALDDEALIVLGRAHDVAQGLAALAVAQRQFDRVSIDLIHSRPEQTAKAWEAELRRALSFGTEHLSAYQLTIEEGTRFHTLRRKGLLPLPDEEEGARMYELTGQLCEEAGLLLYEISNHARPGAESRHNLQYWSYGDYVGIGPGAHGRRLGMATSRIRRPESWIEAVMARGEGMESATPIDRAAAAEEALLMGLRLRDGIAPARFRARTGVGLDAAINGGSRRNLQENGFLAPGPILKTTKIGRLFTNYLLVELTRGVALLEKPPHLASGG